MTSETFKKIYNTKDGLLGTNEGEIDWNGSQLAYHKCPLYKDFREKVWMAKDGKCYGETSGKEKIPYAWDPESLCFLFTDCSDYELNGTSGTILSQGDKDKIATLQTQPGESVTVDSLNKLINALADANKGAKSKAQWRRSLMNNLSSSSKSVEQETSAEEAEETPAPEEEEEEEPPATSGGKKTRKRNNKTRKRKTHKKKGKKLRRKRR